MHAAVRDENDNSEKTAVPQVGDGIVPTDSHGISADQLIAQISMASVYQNQDAETGVQKGTDTTPSAVSSSGAKERKVLLTKSPAGT